MAHTEELVAIDTPVYYWGSITARHGMLMVVNGVRTYFEDGQYDTRYTLRYGLGLNQILRDVRRTSFKALVTG